MGTRSVIMQIMPIQYSESIDNPYLGDLGYQEESSTSFADEMERQQLARAAVDSGESHSVDAALDPIVETEPLDQGPYNLTSNDGVTYTSEEVFFTQSELEQLHRDLQDKGVSAEQLDELRKLANQADGATLHQVLSSFYNQREYAQLSDSETAMLKNIASKIDPSGKLSESLMAHVHGINGKDGQKFLNDLLAGMSKLANGERITLDKNEVAVLAKAAGLSADSTNKLLGGFGPYDSLQFNHGELSSFLSPATHEFAQADKNLAKLDQALDETLGPILRQARARMQKEEEAYALSLRSTEQSKILIQNTVLENVNKNLEAARIAQQGASTNTSQQAQFVAKSQDAANIADSKQTRASVNDVSKNTIGENLANKIDVDAAEQNIDLDDKSGHFDNLKDNSNSNNAKQDGNLNDLLQKADVKSMASVPTTNITTPVVSIGGFVQNAALNNATSQLPGNSEFLSHQAANQVEKAMLSAAKDGARRLDLQLHPAELGAVTITLTSRNGELNALIRSERPETTELLHKQLDHIRATLEQQGVKIEKLEVQTNTPENNSQYEQWDGMQEHNARQEESSRRDVLERLRNLGKVRNDGTNLDLTTLEHSVQLDSHAAITAGQPLHIVA